MRFIEVQKHEQRNINTERDAQRSNTEKQPHLKTSGKTDNTPLFEITRN